MADITDVEKSLLAALGPVLAGRPIRAYRGWPTPAALEADFRQGISHLSLFQRPGVSRTTTRFPRDAKPLPRTPTTLHAVTGPGTVTFSGIAGVRHVAGIAIRGRPGVPDEVHAISCEEGMTSAALASAIAAMIPGATVTGSVVTVPGPGTVEGRTDTWGATSTEIRRQEAGWQLGLWCPTPAARDDLGSVVDAALARMDGWLALPDGSAGRLQATGSIVFDKGSENTAWRRDFMLQVEFPTTDVVDAARVLFGGVGVEVAGVVGEAEAVLHVV